MYLKLYNGQVVFPYNLSKLKVEKPTTAFPKVLSEELLESFGIYKVVEEPIDYNPETHYLVIGEPQETDGQWSVSYTAESYTEEELSSKRETKAKQIRQQRDELLKNSDWLAIRAFETGEVIPEEWAAYRQSLRDITEHEAFPDVNIPITPNTIGGE